MAYNEDLNPLKLLLDPANNNGEFSQKIADLFPAIIYIYDVDSRKLRFINQKVTDFLGYTFEDVESWDNEFMRLVFKDDVDLVQKELRHLLTLEDNESYSYDSRLNQKEGNWKYFRTCGTVLRRDDNNKASSILFIAQDISQEVEDGRKFRRLEEIFNDAKSAQQSAGDSIKDIAEQMQLYRDLAEYKRLKQENEEYLGYGTWEFDVASKRFRWSDGMYRLFGYDPGTDRFSMEVTEDLYKKHIDEEEFEMLITIRNAMLDGKEEKYSWQFCITDAHGNIKKLETSGKLVYNNEGKWIKTVGTSRDITQLSDYQHSLEEKIRDLNRSNKELEEFAYVASHDLNEPLRKITTFIERLNNKYKSELGDDGVLYLNRIIAAVDNMRKLIDTLLEFSRTARRAQPMEMVDLNIILTEVRSDLELKIEETGTTIVADKLPVIEAVPSQMKQVFDNLLNNSIKFRQPQSSPHVTVTCQKLNKKELTTWNLDAARTWYKIDFTDNGIGFEPEYSEKIFQIFQRLHGKSEYPGSGIGLAICKKITDHMNGIIYAQGIPGKGATFTIILPERQ